MATKAPNTNFHDEPSIIIDPSLYVPEEKRWLLQTVCETFIDVTRVLVAITFSGTAAFSGAQALMQHHFALAEAHGRAPVMVPSNERAAGADRGTHASGVAMDLKLASSAPAVGVPCGARGPEAAALCLPTAPTTPAVASPQRAKPARPVVDVAAAVRTARRMLALNRLDEAEAAYRKVLVVDERQPAALTGLARIHLARGALDEALVLAQRAVELAPDQSGGQLALGDALRAKGVHAPTSAPAEVAASAPTPAQVAATSDATAPKPL